MKVGEQDLARSQQGHLGRLRFLDLDDEIGRAEQLGISTAQFARRAASATNRYLVQCAFFSGTNGCAITQHESV